MKCSGKLMELKFGINATNVNFKPKHLVMITCASLIQLLLCKIVQQVLKIYINRYQPPTFHTNCQARYDCGFVAPKMLVFNIPKHRGIIDREIHMKGINGANTILRLKGIIYHGNFHFISRIITNDGKIWLHDGMTSGRNSIMEGNMQNITHNYLTQCKGKVIALAIYAQN